MGKALTVPTQVMALPVTAGQPVAGLQSGIHITWNLPDGLARGVADPDETRGLDLPELPDRWLVMRLNPPGADGKRTTKSWIIDSWRGSSSPVAGQLNTPGGAVTGQRLTILGMMDAQGNFVNPPDPMAGPGAEAFAMYYPTARSRFGFHDPLGDVSAGPLSYVVVGWYADRARDPLAGAGSEWKRLRFMRQAGWRVDGVTFAAATEAQIDRSVQLGAEMKAALEPRATSAPAPAPVVGTPATVTSSSRKAVKMGSATTATTPTRSAATPAPTAAGSAPTAAGSAPTAAGSAPTAAQPASANGIVLKGFEPVPDHLIVHGLVVNVPWNGRGGGFANLNPTLPQAGRVDFTIGDSFGDALTSLLTDQNALRWLFQVLQGSGLRSLQSLDALASIQADLHRQGFAVQDAKAAESLPVSAPRPDPASLFRSGPYWRAGAPLVVASNAGRGFRYGHDGRYEADGKVKCRITGQRVQSLRLSVSWKETNGTTRTVSLELRPSSVAILPTELGQLDPAVRELIEEALLLDPVSAPAAGAGQTGNSQVQLVAAFTRESTFWWTRGLEGIDPAEITDRTQYTGVLPSPLAMTPWTDPWVTQYLEYEAAFYPTTGAPSSSWTLGDVERTPSSTLALAATPVTVRGMAPADDGATSVLAGMLEQLLATPGLEAELGESNFAALRTKVQELRLLNVLSFNLGGVDHALKLSGQALRAGMLTFTGLRLVDVFGRKVELDRSRLRATPESWLSVGTARGIALPPRALRPGRVDFRLLSAADDTRAADDDHSPLCGFLAVDYVDRALEVYDAAGANLGQLRVEGGVVVFDPAPGREALASERGTAGDWNPHLRRVVQGLLDAGRVVSSRAPDPLSSLLALIDAVRHTIDRRGSSEEHLALLLGDPIAVVRARAALQLEAEVVSTTPAPAGTKIKKGGVSTAPTLAASSVTSSGPAFQLTARLGSLAQLDDGLLGYVVDSDPGRFQTPLSPSVRLEHAGGGIDHTLRDLPILAPGAELELSSDGRPIHLTLLMTTGSGVYASSGAFPRVRQALTREWVEAGLKRMAPTFAFGPLLVEPSRLQMPLPGSERFGWSWVHRTRPAGGIDGWEQLEASPGNDRAVYPNGVVLVEDGWITGRRVETP